MTMLQESEACHQVAERMARQALEVKLSPAKVWPIVQPPHSGGWHCHWGAWGGFGQGCPSGGAVWGGWGGGDEEH